jgi:phosphoglycolate phosphatase
MPRLLRRGALLVTIKGGALYTEAVVFDYDGTLAHLNINFRGMRQGVEDVLADYGIEPDAHKGLLILEMIEEATRLISEKNPLEGPPFHHRALELVTEHEVRAAKKGRIFSGVINMLRLIRRRGVKVGIVTRNCSKAVRIIFPDIEDFCDVFIPRDYVSRVKPHPEHLVLTLARMAADNPGLCLMVGDHVIDIEGGKRVGMKTAGVLTGKATYRDFVKAGADFILDDATKIPECILTGEGGEKEIAEDRKT